MKLLYPALLAALCSPQVLGSSIFINEIHYDNSGTDTGEFIELVAPSGTDLSDFSVVLYNGSNGEVYNTRTLSGTVSDLGNGFGVYSLSYPSNGIQNGSPDGIALVDNAGMVLQFISYEGSFTAVNGPASDTTSDDIIAFEDSSTPPGASLQLTGVGSVYSDFTWEVSETNSQDATNVNQQLIASSNVFINELHYDNSGSDSDEFVEVAASATTQLDGYSLELYNGNTGSVYATINLSGTIPDQQGGMGTQAFFISGIQNGGPDGLALIDTSGEVVQFLSYEGVFTATDGAAAGLTSSDIGVSEASSTPLGMSLQLGGNGRVYADFTWQTANNATAGEVNFSQTFGNGDNGGENPGEGSEEGLTELFINEFHYDNDGSDTGEFVEIAGPASTDLSSVSVVLYNGNNGAPYATLPLSGIMPDQQNGFGTMSVYHQGIQNGAPDGIALVVADEVIEFISYEGTMVAQAGPAQGMTSIDVEVSESSSTSVGYSLQKSGSGNQSCSFAWSAPASATPDAINNSQTFTTTDENDCGGDNGGETPVELGQCGETATLVSTIQGSGLTTPLANQTVIVEAVVSVVAPELDGFFLQEEASDSDNNESTSEGIFVYAPELAGTLTANQVVRVLATAQEFYDKTQLSNVSAHQVCGSATVAPVEVSLPVTSANGFETFEGMLVTSEQEWVISSNYNYSNFGELVVSPERLYIPTQLHLPGSEEAIALANQNARNRLLVDDLKNSAVTDYYLPAGEFGPQNPVRAGQTINNVTGIMDHDFSAYRVRVTQEPSLINTNPRQATPVLEDGNLTVASFNVLNLFNGNGAGSGFPTSRGADTLEEYQRQLTKIVNAIVAMEADVVGLMEIENDGFADSSAIAQLTAALNNESGSGTYQFINLGGPVGTDEITVGIIYQPRAVTPQGAAKVLTTQNSPEDENGVLFDTRRNRPSVAQVFVHNETQQRFVVDVNHLKSKGSRCGAGDDDNATGQGSCNLTRTRAAQGLATWLEREFADMPVILLGDLNSYAKEDPIRTLNQAGYVDAAQAVIGSTAYSYTFSGEAGTLDYLMLKGEANDWLVDLTEWHINADEALAFDYNAESKPASFLNTLLYRASDHDPVIASFNLAALQVQGDWDQDSDVDSNDIRGLLQAIAGRETISLDYDFNSDGRVNSRDAAMMRTMCTRSRCATE